MKCLLLAPLIFTLFLPVTVIASQQPSIDDISIKISDDLIPLLDLLKEKGFNIKFEIPPRKGVYGLFQSKNKTIWISPISFELGIGRQTILHEATHAVQSCPYGLLTPIGWKLSTSQFIKNEVQAILVKNYDSSQYLIEEEAFSLQGQRNGVDLLLKALKHRCK